MSSSTPFGRTFLALASASFKDADYAVQFGAQLTGKDVKEFRKVQGELNLRPGESPGTDADVKALASVNLQRFYDADSDAARLAEVKAFLKYRNISSPSELQRSLYDALVSYPPMALLINLTMREARPLDGLGEALFAGAAPAEAAQAVTNLIALGSIARPTPSEPGLLPCRVHSFHRGLAGLWVCMDPQCSALPPEQRGGACGKLFSQPRDACDCGARVLELFTCRNCGTAYARAYTNDIDDPNFLWPEAGGAFRTLSEEFDALAPIDLLLEKPVNRDGVEPAEFDLVTGRLNPKKLGARNRQVFLRSGRAVPPDADDEPRTAAPGEFRPCAICGESASFGRSSVQDHQTKGDQPFQALIARQLQVQPPKREVLAWLPAEMSEEDRRSMVDDLIEGTLQPIDSAIEYQPAAAAEPGAEGPPAPRSEAEEDESPPETPDEEGEERPVHNATSENLLDRLLYKGVLPRYAFPTDVSAFHVFDQERSTRFRPAFRFTPSQGLPAALSQYAPGKEVWIANRLWTSGAIYSPMRDDRYRAWQLRRYYYECKYCHWSPSKNGSALSPAKY